MKRANGTGTIVKLSGNRRKPYAVKVSYQARPGLWKQKYIGCYAKAAEAQAALERHISGGCAASGAPMTLSQVYEQWSVRKYAKAKEASVRSYKASWGRVSKLGSRQIQNITLDELQAIIDQDEADGKSQSTINNDKLLICSLFEYAAKRDIIDKDYSQYLELPSVAAKMEKGVFSDIQLAKLGAMAAQGFPWADTVLILCYTGFRISELLELTVFDYDKQANCLRGGMKTEAGKNRLIPIHPKIEPYLARWLALNGDRIICKDGAAVTSAWYRERAFRPVAAALGAPKATPHWCRHTFASRLHTAGADTLAVKRLLGHSNKDVTEHYTHTDLSFLRGELLKVV